jgi:glycosyltransferase involved in cell wall biosynthesis
MKILYLITQADNGGAQKYVLSLAQHFGGEIAAGEGRYIYEEAKKLNLPIHHLKHLKRKINLVKDFLAFIEIFQLIRQVNPEIVHVNSSKVGFLGSIAGKLCGKKIVFTAHGFVFLETKSVTTRGFYIFSEWFASFFRDRIIAISDEDRRQALKNKIISAKKIVTVHNGLGKIDFLDRTEARKQLSLPEFEFVIGSIANFYQTKALDLLINAFGLLPKDLQQRYCLLIIGGGPEKINLTKLVSSLGLSDRINFAGEKQNAAQFLRAFDIFALASHKEGFPLVLLEAMQAGLPIIATDVGGNKEALGDSAILIPPGDQNALTQALINLISDSNLQAKLSSATQVQSKNFTLDKLFSETNQIYQALMQA